MRSGRTIAACSYRVNTSEDLDLDQPQQLHVFLDRGLSRELVVKAVSQLPFEDCSGCGMFQ